MKLTKLHEIKRQFGIVGNSPMLNRAIEIALRIARTNISVLITGENGSGKESFARLIHDMSLRKNEKFVAINCGAIPEGTMDSELFGHEKGAFTSASDTRKGHFEEANGGTVFLDEIGELPLHTQPRLLRILENQEYMRVGSSQKRSVNLRVIAATNVSLTNYVAQKKFREDLYYRIAQVELRIPSLRERPEDIPLLFKKFALDFADQQGTPLLQLSEGAEVMLKKFPFPGNVRQLKNITWQMATLEEGGRSITEEVLAKYLPERMMLEARPNRKDTEASFDVQNFLYRELVTMKREVEEMKQLLSTILQSNGSMQGIKQYDGFSNLLALAKGNNGSARLEVMPRLPEKGGDKNKEEDLSLKKQEKTLIQKAIAQSKSYKVAARKLGIAERTLYRKIQEYKLDR